MLLSTSRPGMVKSLWDSYESIKDAWLINSFPIATLQRQIALEKENNFMQNNEKKQSGWT